MSRTIAIRQSKEKELLLEQLRKTPIIQIACKRVGIVRATYYRWRSQDPLFAQQADEAIREGNKLINDMAESQLISLIRDKNLGAIVFWLKNHHESYASKLEITAKLKQGNESLTPEQETMLAKAFKLAALTPGGEETPIEGEIVAQEGTKSQ